MRPGDHGPRAQPARHGAAPGARRRARPGRPARAGQAPGEVSWRSRAVRAGRGGGRSRRPTVFSAVREVIDAFAGDDEHLGLYGAFGYDLAFQFEPVTLRIDRPAGPRDLVLHLPDELFVVDRKRETAVRYAYEFTVGGMSTEGLPRDTPEARRDQAGTGSVARGSCRSARCRGPLRGSCEEAKERFQR